jgi:putative redox protein
MLLCHGMESTRGGTKQAAIVRRFVPQGLTVLRFDFSYVGESEGRFEDLTISGEVADALGALDFLAGLGLESCVMVGSSLGGAVALLAAAEAGRRVEGVATIAAVAEASLFLRGLTPAATEAWRRQGWRAWGEQRLRATFLDDLDRIDVLGAAASLDCPLLVLHGDADSVVPPAHARAIAAAHGRARTRMFPGVGHRFEEPGALDGLLEELDDWLGTVVWRRDA